MDWCEAEGIRYVFGLSSNDVLRSLVEPAVDDVRVRRAEADAPLLRRYTETQYRAKSWSRSRRVAARIEASTLGLDIRFVVSNITTGSAEWLYALYRGPAADIFPAHLTMFRSELQSGPDFCGLVVPTLGFEPRAY